MIKKAFGLRASLRPTAQAEAFLQCAIEQIFLWRFSKDLIERFISNRTINFLSGEAKFQTAPADRLLPYLRRRIAQRVAFVIEIALLAQPRNHSFDYRLTGTSLR